MLWHIAVALVLKYSHAMIIHMVLFDDEDLMELRNECDIWLRSHAQERDIWLRSLVEPQNETVGDQQWHDNNIH